MVASNTDWRHEQPQQPRGGLKRIGELMPDILARYRLDLPEQPESNDVLPADIYSGLLEIAPLHFSTAPNA